MLYMAMIMIRLHLACDRQTLLRPQTPRLLKSHFLIKLLLSCIAGSRSLPNATWQQLMKAAAARPLVVMILTEADHHVYQRSWFLLISPLNNIYIYDYILMTALPTRLNSGNCLQNWSLTINMVSFWQYIRYVRAKPCKTRQVFEAELPADKYSIMQHPCCLPAVPMQLWLCAVCIAHLPKCPRQLLKTSSALRPRQASHHRCFIFKQGGSCQEALLQRIKIDALEPGVTQRRGGRHAQQRQLPGQPQNEVLGLRRDGVLQGGGFKW